MLRDQDRSNEIVSVEEVEDFIVFYNFKQEELLRVSKGFYPWLEDYFQGHLMFALKHASQSLEDVKQIVDNQIKALEK